MLNMDFSKSVTIDTTTIDWVPSPAPGVWRKPLAREEAERGHATSIVKYDPGASFKGHNHPLGEEILVLEGTFSDETGDFPAGTYFRNPKGFIHSPFSLQGCVILVKLHQMHPQDNTRLAIESTKSTWQELTNGTRKLQLHSFGTENVLLFESSEEINSPMPGNDPGKEIFVIKGAFEDEFGSYNRHTWIRMAPGTSHTPRYQKDTLLWIKSGHLQTDK